MGSSGGGAYDRARQLRMSRDSKLKLLGPPATLIMQQLLSI